MASKKTNDQCMTWLRSMAADQNSLDGINAQLCIHAITDLKDRLDKLGSLYYSAKHENEVLKRKLEIAEQDKRISTSYPKSFHDLDGYAYEESDID